MRTFAQRQTRSSCDRPDIATSTQGHRNHPILHLQPALDNQAVQQELRANAKTHEAGLTCAASPRFGHDFSRIPIRPPAGAIQTKLMINESGDEYEQEADRVANKVMNMPEALPSITPISASANVYPTSAMQPHGIEGVRSGNTPTTDAIIQRKAGEVDESNDKLPLKKGDKKAELAFHSQITFNTKSGPSSTGPFEEGFTGLEIQWTVWNDGWETAPEHVDRVTIYNANRCSGCRDEKDEFLSMDVTVPSTLPINRREGGFRYEAVTNPVGLTMPAGHYDVYVDLDVHDEVEEINEDNNTIFTSFYVKPRSEPDDEGEE